MSKCKLFPIGRLEIFKDEIAAWWEQEALRMTHKQMVEAIRAWFKVGKKEAIKLEYNSRENKERWIEFILDQVIANFWRKIKIEKYGKIEKHNLKLGFQFGANSIVTPENGQPYKRFSQGSVDIIGTVYYEGGIIQNFFQRWIDHPFWQSPYRIAKITET